MLRKIFFLIIQVFKANEDKDTPVINVFPDTVNTRYIRIEPLDFEKAVGLRLEILGCYHPSGKFF